jgi:tRNA-dihydrouridine synthase A
MSGVDEQFFGDPSAVTDRIEVIEKYIPYIEAQLAEGVPLNAMTRHILGLFNGVPGARAWRRYLSENATGLGVEPGQGAGVEVVRDALALMQDNAQTNAA